ncbi:hypothetical protein DPMN_096053 [Dreissena polymorpha]|uniref:G-protein coupled receptors family 1 profile domain-containing protein n=2 Tax=Dreissena polymorpha TaxID=45954 RepID=A0A9D4R453_DREPO|nr:hypothetical protein DPMN_096053 [Dreissena polymorpha]
MSVNVSVGNTTGELFDIMERNMTIGTNPPFPDEVTWGFWIKFVLTPVIVCTGIIGNTLSLIVMKSKALRHKSYSQYLSALAMFDTLTLILRQIRTVDDYFLNQMNQNMVFKGFNDFGCKLFNFIEHVSYLMSSWLIVLMAIERLVAVWMPFKKFRIRRRAGATAAIIILLVAICASQSFRLVMTVHLGDDCGADDTFIQLFVDLTIYFYNMTLTFLLPVGIVLGCNSMVLYQIFKIRKELIQENTRNRTTRAVKKTHRTTCMLLIVSFTFLGALLPLLTMTLVFDFYMKVNGPEAIFLYRKIAPYIDLLVLLSLVNYAVNFFIYIVSGKSFRFELRKVFYRQKVQVTRSFTARSTKEFIYRF